MLCNVAPNPGLLTPSAAYTFSWTGYLGAGNEGNRIKRYRWEIIASDIVEIEMAFDTKLVAPELGYFFTTAIASATTRSLSALAGFSSRAGTS